MSGCASSPLRIYFIVLPASKHGLYLPLLLKYVFLWTSFSTLLAFYQQKRFFFPLLTRKTACPVYLSSQKLSFQKFWMPRAVLRLIPGYPKCCCNSYSIVSSLSLACFSTLMAGTRTWLRSEQAAAAGWDFLSFPAGIYSPPGRLQQPGAAPQSAAETPASPFNPRINTGGIRSAAVLCWGSCSAEGP